jgi:c-di-GMP-related signal transduction protein
MEVFVARQAIFDRMAEVRGYELLFRSCQDTNAAEATDATASLQVITNSFLSIGIEKVLAGKQAFINFPQELLADERALALPPHLTVIEVLESVHPEPAVIEACRALRQKGYTLALDDFTQRPGWDELIDLADILKVDFRATTVAEQRTLVDRYAPRGIHMLAEKIETQQDFCQACSIGYHYFQGYFFARPTILAHREIPGSKLNYLKILREIHQPELEYPAIEALIEREVSLAYKLLRYINSALFSWKNPVESIRQALVVLGEREIRNWVSLAALPTLASDKPDELVRTSLVRARFCESLAPLAGAADRKADLFLLGLFSLLDAMLGRPLKETLAEIRVNREIAAALVGEAPPDNSMAVVYDLVRDYEAGHWDALAAAADRLNLSRDLIPELYVDALAWSERVFRAE